MWGVRRTLVGLLLVGSLAGAPAASAGVSCVWTDVTTPGFSSASTPFAVDASSTTNAWIVGLGTTATKWRARSWLWDGSNWSTEVVPPLPSGAQSLGAVDAVAPDDAWAVGLSSAPGAAMIVHWNGSEWRLTRGPRFPNGTDLRGIVETGPQRAWAVGTAGTHGLALRWNGIRWRRARLPFDPDRSPSLSSISAISRHDVWAVGTIREPGSDPALGITNPVALHWDGSTWTQVRVPHTGSFPESLASVAARSSDDAWAVGTTADENAPTNPGLIYRWNGIRWSASPHPFIGSGQNRLTGVSAPAADAAWIMGEDGGGTGLPLALVWNGATWASDTLPALPGDMGDMSGVAVLPSGGGWAIGGFWSSSSSGGPNGPWVLNRAC